MRPMLVLPALALALSAGALPTPGHALSLSGPGAVAAPAAIIDVADARNPYGNVDRSNDAGNATGNSEVDRLNDMQLNQNYRGPSYYVGQPPPPSVAPLGGPAPTDSRGPSRMTR